MFPHHSIQPTVKHLIRGLSQVVLRHGVPIDAEVPDYRELDTVPNERNYTADQPTAGPGSADPPSNPPRSPSSASMTPAADFSKQVPVDESPQTAEASVTVRVLAYGPQRLHVVWSLRQCVSDGYCCYIACKTVTTCWCLCVSPICQCSPQMCAWVAVQL